MRHENGVQSLTFTLSLFDHVRDVHPKEAQLTWAQMCARFEQPSVREAKDGTLFSPAVFRPTYRLQENVTKLSLLVLDYDHNASIEDDLVAWRTLGCCFAAYTTHSHRRVTKSNPEAEDRFRVVIPLTVPIIVGRFPALWQWAARISDGKIDLQAQDASRMYYTPAIASSDALYQFVVVDGEPLDWRTLKLDHLPESHTPAAQPPLNLTTKEFDSWDELNAETSRRIRQTSKARTDRKGWTHAPGICHDSTEGKALYVSPEGAYGCHKGCTPATIRCVFGLPEKPLTAEPEQSTGSRVEDNSALRIVCMADVAPETVRWLWHPYIALGKLTILEGDPGLGKSWLTCALASAVSCGRGLPGAAPFQAGNVLMLSAEDGLGDTLRPRLDAVGADVSRVLALNEALTFDDVGLLKLEATIIEYKPKLVIIDPLFGFTGGKVDINRANECRAISAPLAAIAEHNCCALVAVRHLGKSRGGGHALNAGIGSIDFAAAARSVLLVGADPDEPGRRAIVQIKNNLAPHGEAIGYTLDAGQFYWTGASDLTAGRILAAASDEEERGTLVEAIDFLRTALSDGARDTKAIMSEAKQASISEATLRRAKTRLKVQPKKVGMPGSHYQKWMWELPASEDAQEYNEDAQVRDVEHLRANNTNKDSYNNNLSEDAQILEFEHLRKDDEHLRESTMIPDDIYIPPSTPNDVESIAQCVRNNNPMVRAALRVRFKEVR